MSQVEHRGCALHYDVCGQGTPVVFIQGVGVHASGWRPQAAELSASYRCLSFDNRGIGLSQPVGSAVTIEQMSEDVQALMDAEGWPAAHIVGHSLGGLIALDFALSRRSRVSSLSLLCTFADGRVPMRFSGRMIWVGIRTRIGTRRMRRNAFLEMVMPASALMNADRVAMAQSLAQIFGHDLADQPPIVMQQLNAMRHYDATSRLAHLAGIPTLVVSATEDLIAPPWAGKNIAAGIPGSQYIEFGDTAHGLPIHLASAVNELLDGHFRQ